MTEVLFRGEYVEESHANLILARESNPNTPEYKRRLEEQAQAEEQRKKLQQQKRSETRLKEKKVEEYFYKYRQEYPPDCVLSEELGQILWQRARNAVENERRDEERPKQQAEWQRQMEESSKRRKEQREREVQARRGLPERQLQMFLSGKHDYIEPGLKLLTEEFSTGKIIKRMVGQQAYYRLVEFVKPDEMWDSLINRLLDTAVGAAPEAKL